MSGEVEECSGHTLDCICSLEKCIEEGWWHVQSSCGPDESFRAMLVVMDKWKKYLDSLKIYANCKQEMHAILSEQGIDPLRNLSTLILEKMKDIGVAQQKLRGVLDDEVFDTLSKHNPWWESEHDSESDKLYDLRCKLSYFSEQLWDVFAILDNKGEE